MDLDVVYQLALAVPAGTPDPVGAVRQALLALYAADPRHAEVADPQHAWIVWRLWGERDRVIAASSETSRFEEATVERDLPVALEWAASAVRNLPDRAPDAEIAIGHRDHDHPVLLPARVSRGERRPLDATVGLAPRGTLELGTTGGLVPETRLTWTGAVAELLEPVAFERRVTRLRERLPLAFTADKAGWTLVLPEVELRRSDTVEIGYELRAVRAGAGRGTIAVACGACAYEIGLDVRVRAGKPR